jgi:hypothetical protein
MSESVLPTEVARPQPDGATGFDTYDVLGYRAVVGSADPVAHERIRRIFRGFGPVDIGDAGLPRYVVTPDAAGGWHLDANGLPQEEPALTTLLSALEWHVVTHALTERTDLFQLHGAALCAPTEPAGLVIVGDSGVGKSTLGLALTLRGCVPFSDDVALVDHATLKLQPMKRSYHLSDDSRTMLSQFYGHPLRWPDEPEGYYHPSQWAERAVPVRWIFFLEPQGEPRVPALEPLTPADAARAILSRAPNLARAPRLTLSTTSGLIAQASCYRLKAADLPSLVDVVLRVVGAPPASA